MLIATRQKLQLEVPPLNIVLNGTPIKQVEVHELLGVTIDNQLQWQPHVDRISKIISRKLYLLSRIRYIVDEPTRKIFFHAHIKPHFDYCSNIWDSCSDNIFKKLNSLHRRAINLTHSSSCISTEEKYIALNILPLKQHLLFNKAVFMFKIVTGEAPEYLTDVFQFFPRKYSNSRQTLTVIRPRIDLFKSSLLYSGASLYNSLPNSVKSLGTVKAFKTNLLSLFKK